MEVKEGIVLDREGNPLTGPKPNAGYRVRSFHWSPGWPGLIFLGLALPVLGVGFLAIAGILVALLAVSWLLRPLLRRS